MDGTFPASPVMREVEELLAEEGFAQTFAPLEIGGAPLFTLRDQDGQIRSLHNVCRHRGAKLVTEPCQKRTLTCPNHA